MPEMSYTAVFELNEHGGYTVTVPAMPGLVTEGETLEEAKVMAQDAMVCYLRGLAKDGEPAPIELGVIIEPVKVPLGAA
jgi:antitoxin HicB